MSTVETVEQLGVRLARDHPDVAGLLEFEIIDDTFFSMLRQLDVVVDDETIARWPAELAAARARSPLWRNSR